MTTRSAGFSGAQNSGQRDEIIQRGVVTTLRFLLPKHFEGATGDELAETVRAWQIRDADPDDTEIVDSEERELVDWQYEIAPDGTHHLWLWYAE
jgi:hypothetical protein